MPAAVPGLIDWGTRFSNRLHVKHVTRRSDPDLVGIDELQSSYFSSDVADEMGEIRRYVAQSRHGIADTSDTRPYFIALALKYRGVVVGYLTAEYFAHTQMIFLWYILVDSSKVPQHTLQQRGSLMLLQKMATVADATGIPWVHVVTEVEASPSDLRRAKAKMLLFGNAAEELSWRAARPAIPVYRLPIRYRQPILHVDHLPLAKEHEVPEWLLYAPRHMAEGLSQVRQRTLMSRELATRLLDTLLMKGYANAFAHSSAYGEYCRAMLEEYVALVPDELPLERDPHAPFHEGPVPTGAPNLSSDSR